MRFVIEGSLGRLLLQVAAVCFAAACCGCAGLGARAAAPIIGNAVPAIEREPDPVFAREALPGQIKLLEGLLESAPSDRALRRDASRALFAYAFLFVEDEDPARAGAFYLRARAHALRALGLDESFCTLPEADFSARLAGLSRAEPLFWLGAAWSGWLNLNMSDPDAIAQLSNLRALLERVIALDGTYYFGMPYVLLGALEANLPRMFGGRTEFAAECFSKALEISEGRLLAARYMSARYYCVAAQNAKLFDEQLAAVASAPDDALPEQRLMNAVIKLKAAALSARRAEYFLEGDEF